MIVRFKLSIENKIVVNKKINTKFVYSGIPIMMSDRYKNFGRHFVFRFFFGEKF